MKLALLAVLALAALAACSAGGQVAAPVDYDPCALVTKTDAEAILGQTATYTKSESPDPSHKACAYGAKSPTSTRIVTVFVERRFVRNPLGVGPDRDMWKAVKRVSEEHKPIQPVAGLGRDAFLEPGGRLYVLTDKVILDIWVDGFKTDAQNADAAKAFAQKALDRM